MALRKSFCLEMGSSFINKKDTIYIKLYKDMSQNILCGPAQPPGKRVNQRKKEKKKL